MSKIGMRFAWKRLVMPTILGVVSILFVVCSARELPAQAEKSVIVGGDQGDGTYVVDLPKDSQSDEEVKGLYQLLKRIADKQTPTNASTFAFGLYQREGLILRNLTQLGNKHPATQNWSAVCQLNIDLGFRQFDGFGLAVGDSGSIRTIDGFRTSLISASTLHWIQWSPSARQLVITTMTSDGMKNGPAEFMGSFSLRAKSVTSVLGSRQSVGGSLESKEKTTDAKISFSSETTLSKKRLLVDLNGLGYRFTSGLVSVSRMVTPSLSELRVGFRSNFTSDGSISGAQVVGVVDNSVCTTRKTVTGSGKLVDKVLVLGADLSQETRCALDANQVAASVSFNVSPGSNGGAYNVLSLVSQPTGVKNRNKAMCEAVFGSTFNYQFSATAGSATISTAENRQGETRPEVLANTSW